MELRGFDDYEVTLGDKMRGERASLGKSLSDAERELRISAKLIVAIENCDLEAFPNQSVVAGYVRSYARYLGMDADECYQRFCEATGFQSPTALLATGGTPARGRGQRVVSGGRGSEIAQSRFAMPPAPRRFGSRISLAGLISGIALVALVGGLGFGLHSLLQDIQRVDFAPIPQAPEVVAEAPVIGPPDAGGGPVARPDPAIYADEGRLAALVLPAQLPPPRLPPRDGPISALDPERHGVFAGLGRTRPAIDSADDAIAAAGSDQARPVESRDAALTELPATPQDAAAAVTRAAPEQPRTELVLHATEESWVRIRTGLDTIFERIMGPGEQFALPGNLQDGVLRSGNPGGIYMLIDGVPHGPLGRSGRPANVEISAELLRDRFPAVAPDTLELEDQALIAERRAQAALDD